MSKSVLCTFAIRYQPIYSTCITSMAGTPLEPLKYVQDLHYIFARYGSTSRQDLKSIPNTCIYNGTEPFGNNRSVGNDYRRACNALPKMLKFCDYFWFLIFPIGSSKYSQKCHIENLINCKRNVYFRFGLMAWKPYSSML